ncbi:GNAT family N-acetyltransferase [Candidimonas nitroreducens]|uniref:GNAT family N-acetyltransferase n=1 Tax=Candidimonas nitroreducens TaxID=683354 RepID=A0A225M4W5_9BURK|nr:GNAT family N-acetyltransferase [Candidimonas nitroreducens]OWT55732.1 GNAT family N-acetyltransferase [Candidimonas nitroreducens]
MDKNLHGKQNGQQVRVLLGDWPTCQRDALAVRYEVFVDEQHVPAEIEADGEDAVSLHAVAYDGRDVPVGTGRLLRDAHIGRMAVRAPYRGHGVGSRILMALVDEARARNYPQVVLSAQVHARAFYEAHGFVAQGATYMEAGIEHVAMSKALSA